MHNLRTLEELLVLGESWGIELCGEGPTEIRRVRAGGPGSDLALGLIQPSSRFKLSRSTSADFSETFG